MFDVFGHFNVQNGGFLTAKSNPGAVAFAMQRPSRLICHPKSENGSSRHGRKLQTSCSNFFMIYKKSLCGDIFAGLLQVEKSCCCPIQEKQKSRGDIAASLDFVVSNA